MEIFSLLLSELEEMVLISFIVDTSDNYIAWKWTNGEERNF